MVPHIKKSKQSIKKAIIAAAGKGSRFAPLSLAYPKEMIPIMEKPLIQLHIEELINAGITEICIVHRSKDNVIKKYFTNNQENIGINQKIKFTFIEQNKKLPYGNASPILAAKKFVGKDDFIYFFGDDITIEKKPGNFLKEMIELFKKEKADGVLATTIINKNEISKYGTIEFKKNNKHKIVREIHEKLPKELVKSNYIQLFKFIYKNKIIKYLSNQKIGKDSELWLTDTNNTIAKNGKLIALPLSKKIIWCPSGDPINWLKTNILYSLKNNKMYSDKLTIFFTTLLLKNKKHSQTN